MKTLMITKQAWKEVLQICAEDKGYTFVPEQLERDVESAKTRNAAVGIISSLRAIGILDGDGKLTELGLKWSNGDTYSAACSDLAELYFPETTRIAILEGRESIAQIASNYARIEGMREAGARKNVRVLTMLLEGAKSPVTSTVPSVPDDETMKVVNTSSKMKREKRGTHGGNRERAPEPNSNNASVSGARARVEITIPLEKLSDVMLAVFSVVHPGEAPADVRFI